MNSITAIEKHLAAALHEVQADILCSGCASLQVKLKHLHSIFINIFLHKLETSLF
ncbi:MAG: hypothetical protein ACTFAL_03490 [Candidatus Electronema sp. V4]|uniref:hypothetical protein n=1 Tax=Candidatus Electronema sp. V4 TaxID=3454756 RepID=UPI0040553BC6